MNYSLDNLKKQNATSFKRQGSLGVKKENSSLNMLRKGIATTPTAMEKRVDKCAVEIIDETAKFMRENITELIFLIDRSTTCSGMEPATCLGYNDLIQEERRKGFPTKVTTVLFSSEMDVYSFRTDINNILPLDYRAGGGTSLYDILYKTITQVKEARVNDVIKPNRTVVAIMTDGLDECSVEHSQEDVRKLVLECQKHGWQFIFFGALNNAQMVAEKLGINYTNSVQTENTQEDMQNTFASIGNALEDLRKYGKLTDGWAKSLNKNKAGSLNGDTFKRLELK